MTNMSPRSSPLFAAGIMQSGGLWLQSLEQSQAASAVLVQASTCNTTNTSTGGTLACMRSLKALDLVHSQLTNGWTGAGPCADGFEFPRSAWAHHERPLLRMTNSTFTAKPMLVGTNLNESGLFDCFGTPVPITTPAPVTPAPIISLSSSSSSSSSSSLLSSSSLSSLSGEPPDLDEAGMRQRLAAELGIAAEGATMDRVVAAYNGTSDYHGSWRSALIDVHTDRDFFCDSRALLDAAAHRGVPAFQYRLDHPWWAFRLDACLGTPHMTDIIFLFGNLDAALSSEERALGRRMRAHWTAFATNHAPLASWPTYGGPLERRFMAFNTPEDDGSGHRWKAQQCDLLDSLL